MIRKEPNIDLSNLIFRANLKLKELFGNDVITLSKAKYYKRDNDDNTFFILNDDKYKLKVSIKLTPKELITCLFSNSLFEFEMKMIINSYQKEEEEKYPCNNDICKFWWEKLDTDKRYHCNCHRIFKYGEGFICCLCRDYCCNENCLAKINNYDDDLFVYCNRCINKNI